MKIAMIITGVTALILTVIGCISYVRALKNEDAEKMMKTKRWFAGASPLWTTFFILLIIQILPVLFSFL